MKKWIFSLMLLVLAVLLVACGNTVDTNTKFVAVDYSDALLGVSENTKEAVESQFKSQQSKIKFYEVKSNTAPVPVTYSDTFLKPHSIDLDNMKVTYKIGGGDPIVINYYLLGTNDTHLVVEFKDINGLKYQKGASIDHLSLDSFAFYEVNEIDGSKTPVLASDVQITAQDWPLTTQEGTNRPVFFQGNVELSATYNNNSQSFKIRVDGGEDPIRWETSNWWNKISSYPIGWVAGFFGSLVNNSFGFAILITTILVRTLAWPIYARSNAMTGKMGEMQPELQKLEQKYALKKDPQSQQRKQMEMAQIYKKNGVGLSGCLMPFLQMPIFIAMYQVVRRVSIPGGAFDHQVNNTMFLGFINLAGNESIWRFVFAAIVGITMFLLQKLSAKKPNDAKKTTTHLKTEQQQQQEKTTKIMMYVMIGIMVVTASSSTALGYYWIIGNVYSLLQTYITRKITASKANKKA